MTVVLSYKLPFGGAVRCSLELLGVGLGNAVSTCEQPYVVSIGVRKDGVGAYIPLRVRRERSSPQNTQGTR